LQLGASSVCKRLRPLDGVFLSGDRPLLAEAV
jgi:hypothetical protein